MKRGDVVLKRRDGEALRLSRDVSERSQRDALAAVARLLTPLLSGEPRKEIETTALAQLPWISFLPKDDRHLFVSELLTQFKSCADLGDFASLARLVDEWKNTAMVFADGLGDELKRPLPGTSVRVPRPGR